MAFQVITSPSFGWCSVKVVFRVDASLLIGTGHVMRCLALADALSANGADCHFICRLHEGNLIEFIRRKGYTTHSLSFMNDEEESQEGGSDHTSSLYSTEHSCELAHSSWLGATQAQDYEACAPILAGLKADWLVVDHYALDARWERSVAPFQRKLMVIDDLADRPHACDLLLDQTFRRDAADYRQLVAPTCQLLCGSQYSLLRPEFNTLRPYSLQRRLEPYLRRLLINMGGVDKDNVTGQVMQALQNCDLPQECHITVVMGATSPWLHDIRARAEVMQWKTSVLVGVSNMGQLMADSDLAIGAAGATSWERCCLGLPTIMVVQASNQNKVALELELAKAALVLPAPQSISEQLPLLLKRLASSPSLRTEISQAAARVTDGLGANAITRYLGC